MAKSSKIILSLSVVMFFGLASSQTAQAQPRPGQRDPGPLSLLMNEQVRQELELVDDQVKKLGGVMREMFTALRDRGLSQEERRELFLGFQKKAEDVLLPHQTKRLKEIDFQQRLRRYGTAGALMGERFAEELEITDQQKEKLKKVSEEVSKELREKISKLQKEARDKILAVLTPQQRKKIEDLSGKPFEIQRRRPDGGGQGGENERGRRPD